MPTELLPNTLQERQLALEAEMRGQGLARFKASLQAAQAHGRESTTKYGQKLLAGSIEPIVVAINEFLKVTEEDGRAARLAISARKLALIEPEVAAYIASKVILDAITQKQRLQTAAVRIGRMIEDEVRLACFEEAKQVNPATGEERTLKAYANTIRQRVEKESSDYRYKRRVLVDAMNKIGVEWTPWSESDCLHLGVKLIELTEQTTGMVARENIMVRNRSTILLVATEETLGWIQRATESGEFNAALYQPMIVPPVPWTKTTGGGYLGGEGNPLSRMKLVKTRNRPYLEELQSQDMGLVFSSLNAIQATPWKINGEVLAVMREFWRTTNSEIGKLPPRENRPLPTKPVDIATNAEARKVWKRSANRAIKENIRLASKRLQVYQVIQLAEKFAPEEAIYFPHNLDFRGRVYSIPAGLNPQGHDISKGLLTFAKGKALETERAAEWLAIHGANLFGYDKVTLQERVKWVRDNEALILQCAAEPLDCLWWGTADKPWQFLAFCFEWAGYIREGLAFESHLPIALDGSCNGLQHFSAMLRDPVGGAAVNLIPSSTPHDIYGVVASKTLAKLAASRDPLAAKWLAFGVTRKTTKRPVMVVPYGGTRFSARAYLEAHIAKRIEDEPGLQNPFGDKKETFRATKFLAGFVWESIRETVVAARDAMDWLQKVSRVVSKYAQPFNWTAPSGFRVQQAYPNVAQRIVETRIAGSVVKLSLAEEVEGIDKRRQAQGIAPNFVHSLDAAALMFTVDAAGAFGLDSFAMIHDSYGTHAADTEALRECLRQSFCQMYQQDVLKDFRDEIQKGLPVGVELPPLPAKGTLDINLVLQSDFFFA